MKIHTQIKSSLLFALALAMAVIPACETIFPPSSSTSSYTEKPKDISGSWQIAKVSRNGEDITGKMDFSRFRINFSDDNTYSIENYLPFIVREDGNWSLDDPQYPFKITFEAGDSSRVTDFNYPIVDGKRRIVLNFSPGCPSNSYEYVLQRVTE